MENKYDNKIMSILESYMFTFSEPIYIQDISYFFKINNIQHDNTYIKNIIDRLEEKYKKDESGLEILKLEDKYQLVAKKDNFEYLEKVISKTKKKNLTQSALETLTIIAYNQPTTKSFVEKIKGVKSDTTISKLLDANLIQECGRLDKIGRPMLYKTTDTFLKHIGISSLDELPKSREFNSEKEQEEI